MTESQWNNAEEAILTQPEKASATAVSTMAEEVNSIRDAVPVKTNVPIADILPNVAVGDFTNMQPENLEHPVAHKLEKFKDVGKIFDKKEMPLTATEQFMANHLRNAINSGDLKGTVAVLKALSDDLGSARRVLSNVRNDVSYKFNDMTFKTGQDENDRNFIQIQFRTLGQTLHASNEGARIERTAPRLEKKIVR